MNCTVPCCVLVCSKKYRYWYWQKLDLRILEKVVAMPIYQYQYIFSKSIAIPWQYPWPMIHDPPVNWPMTRDDPHNPSVITHDDPHDPSVITHDDPNDPSVIWPVTHDSWWPTWPLSYYPWWPAWPLSYLTRDPWLMMAYMTLSYYPWWLTWPLSYLTRDPWLMMAHMTPQLLLMMTHMTPQLSDPWPMMTHICLWENPSIWSSKSVVISSIAPYVSASVFHGFFSRRHFSQTWVVRISANLESTCNNHRCLSVLF